MTTAELTRPAVAAAEPVVCDHCGLPVPAGFVRAGVGPRFCCAGCHTAWDVIHDTGLAGYYRLAERRRSAVESSRSSYEEFDHP
ncbi:MAG TPA: heavy metal translocating P-type ATPase metal-binding domain-containing protein, partial [Dongiaceae bacterium]|nr:heavy metal translocating P-type ATPase metal-binding domain-containing protein [Dongiaceae bacterium]